VPWVKDPLAVETHWDIVVRDERPSQGTRVFYDGTTQRRIAFVVAHDVRRGDRALEFSVVGDSLLRQVVEKPMPPDNLCVTYSTNFA
jgi:hypothetical protein